MSDLIDRQAAIDALLHNQEVYSNNFGTDAIDKYTIAIIDNDVQTIAQLPSAEPERKLGRWNIKLIRPVYGGVTFRVDARCSECCVFIAQTTAQRKMTYRFCPFCGADMRGKEDA